MNKSRKQVRNIGLTICIAAFSTFLQAQQGQTGIGLRLGTDPGFTVKHFVRQNAAVEGILHTGYRGLLLTGLYEWHKPLTDPVGLKFYFGVGGHVGAFNRYGYYHYGPHHEVYYTYNRPSLGPDGIIGIEYDFDAIPLNVGIDLKPALDFYDRYTYMYLDGALSLRVLL